MTGATPGTHTLYVIVHSAVQGTTFTMTRSVVVPVASSGNPILASVTPPLAFASTSPPTTWAYAYDGDGLLRSRSDGTTTTTFVWDPSTTPARIVAIADAGGTTNIVYGLGLLYQNSSVAGTTSFARDGLGSVRAEVTSTANSLSYSAYGQKLDASEPNTFGFAGELHDPTGLSFMRARWYDPAMGLFLRRDGLAGFAWEPTSLNGFVYASDRPTTLTDASGNSPDEAIRDGLEFALDTGIGYAATRFPVAFVRDTTVVETPNWALIETRQLVEKPLVRNVLESKITSGAIGGAVQGLTDYFLHPELTGQQRVGRIAVAVGVSIVAAAAVPIVLPLLGGAALGAMGTAIAGAAIAGATGYLLNATVVQNLVYPKLGLGAL